ncbi:glycosyl hydrolase family 28-related protein [Paenibacillus polymyxa]|uniref:glycosyl hydrolase family 28-related protein n=1 Tax=Paenibacillus polymyxa TaxID=1406 RepID=UPI0006C06480|nr:glycosyl hydrolase family 28-related protein [Paenibacillus polymyxa]KOS04163.1 hypothetical protein AM598_02510 [Paenibacillus polymyxa]
MTLPWRNNTSEDIASQTKPRYETPQGAQLKADKAEANAKKYSDDNFAKSAFKTIKVPGRLDVVADDKEDVLTIEGRTGIAVTTNPQDDRIIITATGDSIPGQHGTSHLSDGADPIPYTTATTGGLANPNAYLYNPKDYGAVGDGITDDSDAAVAAITAAAGKPVYFPPGRYNLESMTGVGGKVQIFSNGDAVLKGFHYKELNAPLQNISATTSEDDAYFTASNLVFEGTATKPGLKIENQSQGTFIRSFQLFRCTFRGNIGLETKNCLDSSLLECVFIQNQYGWKALSCTNLTVANARFFSSPGYCVYIDRSDNDTANRYGGESIKFTNCQWFDSATAVQCINHNYLTLENCMIDYVNMGVYLKGSKFARLVSGVYIGYTAGSRSSGPLGIAPTKTGCVYAEGDQARSFTAGIEISDAKLTGYSDAAADLVTLDGTTTTFNGVENSSIRNSQLHLVGTTPTTKYHLNIMSAQDITHMNNRYYAPNNNQLLAPWLFTGLTRIISQQNNFTNSFNSSGTVLPATGYAGNEVYESSTLTLTCNGTDRTDSVAYAFRNKYTQTPRIVAMVRTSPSGIGAEEINVANVAQDSTQVFIRALNVKGTVMTAGTNVVVDLIILGV